MSTTTTNLNLLDAMMRGPVPDMLAGRPAWMDDGSCTTADPDLFFPSDGDSSTSRHAKAICATCPVKATCLEYALANGEKYGIWGGTGHKDRQRIRRDRRGKAHRTSSPTSYTGRLLRHLDDEGPWEGSGVALCNHVLGTDFRSPGSILTHMRMHGYVDLEYDNQKRISRITITAMGLSAIGRAATDSKAVTR